MAYRLPIFNLTVKVWTGPVLGYPPVPPPRITPQASLRVYKTGLIQTTFSIQPFVAINFPKLTDIRPGYGLTAGLFTPDVVECPSGSGRFYVVFAIEDVAKGFTNEYRMAVCQQKTYTGAFPIT